MTPQWLHGRRLGSWHAGDGVGWYHAAPAQVSGMESAARSFLASYGQRGERVKFCIENPAGPIGWFEGESGTTGAVRVKGTP